MEISSRNDRLGHHGSQESAGDVVTGTDWPALVSFRGSLLRVPRNVMEKRWFRPAFKTIGFENRQAPAVVATHSHLRAIHVDGDEVALRQLVIMSRRGEVRGAVWPGAHTERQPCGFDPQGQCRHRRKTRSSGRPSGWRFPAGGHRA